MTFEEFSKLVMQHLDQYSVAGDVLPDTYNNQVDYTNRICALANMALRTIATQTAPILACLDPNEEGFSGRKDLPNGTTRIEMPQDFWKMTGQGIPSFPCGEAYGRSMHYKHITDKEILVPTSELGRAIITYYRYPRKLQGKEDEMLDATDMVADCASFYVAAQLVRQDDAYLYQTLYNEFETMLARLKRPIIAELAHVEDAYFS